MRQKRFGAASEGCAIAPVQSKVAGVSNRANVLEYVQMSWNVMVLDGQVGPDSL